MHATPKAPRVIAVSPMPPEKCAYALARYSRSPDSIRESLEWVRTHDSSKFLDSFYFQYGHASIADLGHVVLCIEGVSELAATEIEDEPLWDGQAKSSRYQDFSKAGFIIPAGFNAAQSGIYAAAAKGLLDAYQRIHAAIFAHLSDRLPRPDDMKADAYQRNIAARAFDVARYLLFWGIPTNAGQVTSIRTLEKQISRLKASEYEEVRSLGAEIAAACAAKPECVWDAATAADPLAPTLAKYCGEDTHISESRRDLAAWAEGNLPAAGPESGEMVDLSRPSDTAADIVASLLYPVTDRPYRELYDWAASAGRAVQNEAIDLAARSRGRRNDMLRAFHGGPYVFDIVMDIGAYRDLHRHRRCHQYRQAYTGRLGYSTPQAIKDAGLETDYGAAMDRAVAAMRALPEPGSHYLLPFGARSRFLFKMDFAEVEYIARVRTGVKGHFSYREIAWRMKEKLEELEPHLGRLIQATPPWIEDPLKR